MAKNPLCESCIYFKMHGEKCWYYWESKKWCSQHEPHNDSIESSGLEKQKL
ncbi:hypothetical protein GF336_03055 [Candidatus Woesearchaeota archaeon]|nr:hypothetical protein [Candidatus Woesearchaeota archaeon]